MNSLGLKVVLAYLAGMVLSLGLLVIAAVIALQGQTLARFDLAQFVEELATRVRFDAAGQPSRIEADEDDFLWVFDSLGRETAWRLLDDANRVVLQSGAAEAFRGVPTDVGRIDDRETDSSETDSSETDGRETDGREADSRETNDSRLADGRFDFARDGVMFYGATAGLEHGGRAWRLQIAASARLMTLLHRVALPLVGSGVGLFGLVLFIVFSLCAWVTLRYTLKPLRDVSESASAISPRSLHSRLDTAAVPTEIVPLVDSFNRALARLEQGYRVQQDFLGQAAHELKTPLALIRAEIELAEAPGLDRAALLGDVEYMSRQVQQLLRLAEASDPQNYAITRVSPRIIVDEAITYLQRRAEAAGVGIEIRGDGADPWPADRAALFTLLKNLLENAIEHTPAGGVIDVTIMADALTVRDRGPGVDAGQLSLLFDRFWRPPHRRDQGAGLGLAICREIALAHDWSLTVERAEPGLDFRLARATSGVRPVPRP